MVRAVDLQIWGIWQVFEPVMWAARDDPSRIICKFGNTLCYYFEFCLLCVYDMCGCSVMVHMWRSEDSVVLVLTFYPLNSGLQACVAGAFLPEPPLH